MPNVTTKELDQLLIDGGRLLVLRDDQGKVVECKVDPDGRDVFLGIFAIYEKAGLIVPSVENFYAISSVGRERIQRAYTRDARFTRRKRIDIQTAPR